MIIYVTIHTYHIIILYIHVIFMSLSPSHLVLFNIFDDDDGYLDNTELINAIEIMVDVYRDNTTDDSDHCNVGSIVEKLSNVGVRWLE